MTIQPSSEGKRIVFLDSLRAIAVLLVLWGHVFLVGINDPTTVGFWVPDVKTWAYGPTTEHDNINSAIAMWLVLKLKLGVGGMGVSLFFMISGFVILRTIDRTKPILFLVQRLFRIIPTCLFCVVLVTAATYAYCIAKGVPSPHNFGSVFASIFAANYFNSSLPTIPVLWTLEIEMIFYVLMAVAAAIFNRLGFKELILLSVLCLTFVAAYSFPLSEAKAKLDMARHFSAIFVHISYMMIGAIIYRAYDERKKLKGALLTLAGVAIYVTAYNSYLKATGMAIGSDLPSSGAALIIFIVGLFFGMHGKIFTPLHWVASVSYPLYLLHIPLAWGAYYILASTGLGMYTSAILATLFVLFLAWCVHRTIELPSQQLGKKASNLFKPKIALSADGI